MGANGWLPPPGIEINPQGRYRVPCRTCGVIRWLLWHGPVTDRNHRARECATCAGYRNARNRASPIFGEYIEPDPDPVVVELLVRGGDPNLRSLPGERRLAMAELCRRYPWLTAREVASRLNVTKRTVERYRSQLRINQRAAA